MVILYSTGCPQCCVLKEKLEKANIEYTEVSDIEEMTAKGITKVPVLEADGKRMELFEANAWIKNHKK